VIVEEQPTRGDWVDWRRKSRQNREGAMKPLIEVRGVSKNYGGVVQALDDVTIAIYPEEIVGVVGENGAGKSTLMKILAGAVAPDKGDLFYNGDKVPFPKNPKEALRRGISIVYQEKGVIPHLKVYQFLFLGQEEAYAHCSLLLRRRMREQAKAILEELGIACSTEHFMYELPLATQKLVEIARAFLAVKTCCTNMDVTPVVILDEPTAPLALEARRQLFDYLVAMTSRCSFIFVSHIMPEVMEFTDRVYVLRDGKLVASYDLGSTALSEETLFKAIVGRESTRYQPRQGEEGRESGAEVVLEARDMGKVGHYYNTSFVLRRGECLGLFGTAGSGKTEILRTIAGLLSYDKGKLLIKGTEARPGEPPFRRLGRGVGYFSGETGKELFLEWPIVRNVSLLNMAKVVRKRSRLINFRAEIRLAERVVRNVAVKAPNVYTPSYALSGGNKQKVSVGKWLERSPAILLLEDPTIGIDVGAREDIYTVLLRMKHAGISMILVSDDPKEYSILCDRVLVVRDGRVQREVSIDRFEEVILI